MKRKTLVIVVLILILGGLLILFGLHHSGTKAERADIVPPPSVTVERPTRATINRVVELPATIVGLQEAKLYAKVSGYLKSVSVDKGDVVRKGQLLATIDSPELAREVQHEHENHIAALANLQSSVAQLRKSEAEARQAESQVHRAMARQTQAEAEVLRARAGRNLAAVTYQRLKFVYDKDHGLIAKQDVDVAAANLESERAKLSAAEKGLEAAKEEVEVQISQQNAAQSQVAAIRAQFAESEAQGRAVAESEKRAQDLLNYCEIRAPFDGIITGRFLDPGPLVQSAANNAQEATHPVLSMANFDIVRIYVQVPEPDLPFVQPGTMIELAIDELPGRILKGTITRTTGALDEVTRTMLAECDMPNPSHILHPGMMGHEQLNLASHPNALTIPSVSISVDGQKKFVYVVKDNIVKKIPVTVGFEEPLRVEITHGLVGNEDIVVAGKENIDDGTLVHVSTPTTMQASSSEEEQANVTGLPPSTHR